jgi:hypothetical protein
MNGSGTTTVVAQENGMLAAGVELNPVMAILARAKDRSLAGRDEELGRLLNGVSRRVRLDCTRYDPEGEAALWFRPDLYTVLKRIGSALSAAPANRIELDQRLVLMLADAKDPSLGLLDLLWAALLVTVRECARPVGSRNPTWFRPGPSEDLAPEQVLDLYVAKAKDLMNDLNAAFNTDLFSPPEAIRHVFGHKLVVLHADARRLPIHPSSVDVIITSPPYLTRIDYAVTTAPELVFLGYTTKELLRDIRSSIMGSTCIVGQKHEIGEHWGPTCRALVENVRSHSSKASSTYYFKTYVQYFQDAESLLRECLRVLKPGASAFLVVQDSWYKDVHVPLGLIYGEMAVELGAVDVALVKDESVKTHLGLVNSGARRYKKGEISEQVVRLSKPGHTQPL